MLTVTVAQDGSGDFASIAEAVLAVPYKEEALLQTMPGKGHLYPWIFVLLRYQFLLMSLSTQKR